MEDHVKARNYELLTSNKGKPKLALEGHLYHLNKTVKDTYYWSCVQKRSKENRCHGKAFSRLVDNRHVFNQRGQTEHNHSPNILQVERSRFRESLKRRAEANSEPPLVTIRHCSMEASIEVQTMISAAAQKKVCQRSRKLEIFPPNPATAEEFEAIAEKFKNTGDGTPFLLRNLATQSGRLLMFSTADNIKRHATSDVWLMDGTFDTAPENFKQIYTIQGSVGNRLLPLVYYFLPCKSEKCYSEAFEELLDYAGELGVHLQPKRIVTDFEKAAINAVSALFPRAKQQGCFFHWTQNLFKRVQKTGLKGDFSSDKNVYMYFKRTEALAFVPPKNVVQAFECIKRSSPPSMDDFFQYLEEIYVHGSVKRTLKSGNVLRNRPIFDIEFWNVYEATLSNQPRTTNRLEGWHNRWKTGAGSAHCFFEVIVELQREQKMTEGEILRMLQGSPEPKRNAKQIEKDEKLLQAAKQFNSKNIEDYITSIALILKE
ncbi:uncharacterized protein LOC134218618 [Armigeres subalbatus]|uniref:uncharacterized protein LOC134218618 n=1 Tax=Armigeres subalbatus TaxID=124917 RepID=UPI002ED0906F